MGAINDLAWKFGSFGNQLQNNFLQTSDSNGTTVAADLFALNINRGRDHGLQPYVNYVKKCFNITLDAFKNLAPVLMSEEKAKQLQNLYQ